jgi:acylphosphatase
LPAKKIFAFITGGTIAYFIAFATAFHPARVMADQPEFIQRRLVIHGRVQGVGYRAWACAAARRLGLDGWVRNRRDGTVEAYVRGGQAAVEDLIRRCHEGPPAARVEKVESQPADESVTQGFIQRETV